MVSPVLTCIAYFAAIALSLVVRVLTRRPGERPLADFRGTAIPFFVLMAVLTLSEVIYPPRGDWEVKHAPALFPLPVTLVLIVIGLIFEALRLGRNSSGPWGRGHLFGEHTLTFGITAFLIIATFLYVYFRIVFSLHF